ncbi:hypothetical protein ACFYQ5_35115 [Streptomyces sp. NPDC005794]|uniref:hypothetical protein n=1 Tax=Streptomyces sp. NPDC005794 TaxID=3364733 RepID=UPI0036D1A306
MDVDAEPAAVDLAGAQLHQLLGGLGQRRLVDHLAHGEDPLADSGSGLVRERVHTGSITTSASWRSPDVQEPILVVPAQVAEIRADTAQDTEI